MHSGSHSLIIGLVIYASVREQAQQAVGYRRLAWLRLYRYCLPTPDDLNVF